MPQHGKHFVFHEKLKSGDYRMKIKTHWSQT
jgi:hypothetical protein